MNHGIFVLLGIGFILTIFILGAIAQELSYKTKNKKFKKFLEKFADFVFYYFDPMIP